MKKLNCYDPFALSGIALGEFFQNEDERARYMARKKYQMDMQSNWLTILRQEIDRGK